MDMIGNAMMWLIAVLLLGRTKGKESQLLLAFILNAVSLCQLEVIERDHLSELLYKC
jgi:hypothetical protein